MKFYPVLLHLRDRPCAVIGGGNVATNKVLGLLDAEARVTVISPELCPALETLMLENAIIYHQMSYKPGVLTQLRPVLVFAATNDPNVNQQVWQEARHIGALVDMADGGNSDFSNMGVIRRGDITMAISTGGASPTITKHLRQRMEDSIGEEYATLVEWLGEARSQVKVLIPAQPKRQKLWQKILESPILDQLRKGNKDEAKALLDKMIEDAIQSELS